MNVQSNPIGEESPYWHDEPREERSGHLDGDYLVSPVTYHRGCEREADIELQPLIKSLVARSPTVEH